MGPFGQILVSGECRLAVTGEVRATRRGVGAYQRPWPGGQAGIIAYRAKPG
jgi:hypothetical protein